MGSRDLTSASTLAPLRVPAYRRIWAAAVASHLGTFLQMTAAPWLMLELTDSAFRVSLVTVLLLAPRLLFALPAGAIADLLDRRTVMVVGNSVGALAVGSMALLQVTGRLGPGLILFLTFLLGTGSAVAMPSFQTMIPDLVPRPLLPQAITLNSGAFNLARAIGPAIGGALIAADMMAVSFFLNAASFVGVVVVLLTLPGDDVAHVVATPRRLVRETVTGLRFTRFAPEIRLLITVAGVFALTAACVQALLAPIAADIGLGGRGFGLLWGFFGAGALLGVAALQAAQATMRGRMVPAAMSLFGLGGIALGLAPNAPVAAIGLLACGAGWVWTLITLNATVQWLAPTWVRSRVVSIYALVVGLQPVGAVTMGAVASWTGAGNAVAISSVLTVLAGVVAGTKNLPVLDPSSGAEPAGLDAKTQLIGPQVEGPVVVSRTWVVAPKDREEFEALAAQARYLRLRTGASAWELYTDACDPETLVEWIRYPSWEEHHLQRTRLDVSDLRILEQMDRLDVGSAPRLQVLRPSPR